MTIENRHAAVIPCPICNESQYQFLMKRFDESVIVRCSACEHSYLNPPLSDSALEKIYRNYHANSDDTALMEMLTEWFQAPDSPYQVGLNKLNPLKNKSVLDVGCGPGLFLNACKQRGANVLGIDLSPHSVRLAQQQFGIEVLQGELEEAIQKERIRPNSFDIVTAFEIIEHVHKPLDFLALLFKVLKPNGQCILSTPNFFLFKEMGEAAPVVKQWPEHLQYFDPVTLEESLKKSGFKIKEVGTTKAIPSGERAKQTLNQVGTIHQIWQIIRRWPFVIPLKNVIFSFLNRNTSETDKRGWSGLHLLSVASKEQTLRSPSS